MVDSALTGLSEPKAKLLSGGKETQDRLSAGLAWGKQRKGQGVVGFLSRVTNEIQDLAIAYSLHCPSLATKGWDLPSVLPKSMLVTIWIFKN